jgi:hypothetical protein
MATFAHNWLRNWIWLLQVSAVLTLGATLTHQPDPDTQFRAWSEYVTTPRFFISHVVGSILGTSLLILGAFALGTLLASSRRGRAARLGIVATVVGGAGIVAMFGVAAFAQPAIGKAFLAGEEGARPI